MGKIYLPATSPEDWKQLLAAPEKQWKTGFSARALVHCGQARNPIDIDLFVESRLSYQFFKLAHRWCYKHAKVL